MQYAVIGLGKLGASMAAAIASRGYRVVGVDVDPRAVELVNGGHAPVDETELEKTLQRNKERVRATSNVTEAVGESDVIFVVVPTPTDERGAFALDYARSAMYSVGAALRDAPGYRLVVLSSTVLPGATRHQLLPALEQASGRRCGKDFGLCYSPEFIALGSVIHDFLHPDFVLIGQVDERAGTLLEQAYTGLLDQPRCARMSLENAELTKIAVNTLVTTKITFANLLAALCEQIPGGDVDVVAGAVGLDRRIGVSYLKGGLGYGGPCFPRDNVALGFLANQLGVDGRLPAATDLANRDIPARITEWILARLPAEHSGMVVAILGLAYKPATHVIDESQSLELAERLEQAGLRVRTFDPLAAETARTVLPNTIALSSTIEDCLEEAAAVVITTPDPLFATLAPELLDRCSASVLLFDLWRILPQALRERGRYYALGQSDEPAGPDDSLAPLWKTA